MSQPSPSPLLLFILALLIGAGLLPLQANPTTQAKHAYQNGHFAQAQALFRQAADDSKGSDRYRLRFAEAAAAYRQKDYPNALQALTESLREKDPLFQQQVHYNLARTLTAQGQSLLDDTNNQKERLARAPHVLTGWQDALSHYEDTLNINPENTQAQDNQQALTQLIAQLKEEQEKHQKPKQPQQKKTDQPNQKGEQDQENPEQNSNDQEEPKDSKNNQPGKNGENSEKGENGSNPDPQANEKENDPQKSNPDAEQKKPSNPAENAEEKTPKAPLSDAQEKETPAEQARRILAEFADIGETPLHQRRSRNLRQRPNQKDW